MEAAQRRLVVETAQQSAAVAAAERAEHRERSTLRRANRRCRTASGGGTATSIHLCAPFLLQKLLEASPRTNACMHACTIYRTYGSSNKVCAVLNIIPGSPNNYIQLVHRLVVLLYYASLAVAVVGAVLLTGLKAKKEGKAL